MTLIELQDRFLYDKSVYCKASTVVYYRDSLHCFLKYCDSRGISSSDALTRELIKAYVLFLRDSGVKSGAIHSYMRALNNLLSWSIYEGFVPPFQYKVKLPRVELSQELPLSVREVTSCDEYIRMYCRRSSRYLLLFHLMLDCGMRSCEALHLRLYDVDIENKLIRIKESKYDKSRIIPLPAVVEQLLPNGNGDELLVPIGSSTKHSFFSRLRNGTGISRLHAHLLRHTFATAYMMQRGNLEYLRMYLGHASYDVTQVYIKAAYQCELTHYDIYKIDDIFK